MQQPVEIALNLIVFALAFGSLAVWIGIVRNHRDGRSLIAYEAHAGVPWSGFDLLFLVFMALVFEAAGGTLAARGGPAEPGQLSVTLLSASSGARLAWIAFAIVFLTARTGAYLDDLGFDTRRLSSDLRSGGKAFLAALLPVFGVQLLFTTVIGLPSEHPLAKLVEDRPGVGVLVLTTVAAVIVAPLFEEFLFRVLLQGWLEKARVKSDADEAESTAWSPIIVVSTIFALMHYGHGPDPIALFILSLFLGYAYQKTHRIFAPLAIHVLLNGFSMLQLWIQAFLAE